MKIYLSGPITGIEDYKKKFEAAEKEAREKLSDWEPEIFNPANITLPDTATHEDYMKICMQKLADCDTIYLMNGWQESRGACREYGYALGARMAILHQFGVLEHGGRGMRLIDADNLKEWITAHCDIELEPVIEELVLRVIDDQPTACDINTAIARLRELSDWHHERATNLSERHNNNWAVEGGIAQAYDRAIEIVKGV